MVDGERITIQNINEDAKESPLFLDISPRDVGWIRMSKNLRAVVYWDGEAKAWKAIATRKTAKQILAAIEAADGDSMEDNQ